MKSKRSMCIIAALMAGLALTACDSKTDETLSKIEVVSTDAAVTATQDETTKTADQLAAEAAAQIEAGDALPDNSYLANTAKEAAKSCVDPNVSIDYDSFNLPVAACSPSPDGYPVYLVECDFSSRQCVGASGEALGSLSQVASQMTEVLNSDVVMRSDWICDEICIDGQKNVIGAVSASLKNWRAAQHPS